MFVTSFLRVGIGVPLAGLITFALFTFMRVVISGEYEKPENVKSYTLLKITPQEIEDDKSGLKRPKPEVMDGVTKPPPPPKMSAVKSDVDLPTPNSGGAVPADLPDTDLRNFPIDPVAISDREAQPLWAPQPSYPERAATLGIEGSCEVQFDVDTRGRPYNVQAVCTDSVFKREAERAVGRVEFAPKIVRGRASERSTVIYPLEFRLNS